MGYQAAAEWGPPRGGGRLYIYPTLFALIVRRPPERDSGDEAMQDVEVIEARFGLLPSFATEGDVRHADYNARSELVAALVSLKSSCAKGRHCIVPCEASYEPKLRDRYAHPTRFAAADSPTFDVAGLWQTLKSPAPDWVNTFTMLTLNADDHDLMKLMHRPDPKRLPEMKDKRMVESPPAGLHVARFRRRRRSRKSSCSNTPPSAYSPHRSLLRQKRRGGFDDLRRDN